MVWFCAKLRKMMMTKKPGPPVPPRPNIYVQQSPSNKINKSHSSSLSAAVLPMPHGRTVIYKSPSYDTSKKTHQHNIVDGDENDLLMYRCGNNTNNRKKIDDYNDDDDDDHDDGDDNADGNGCVDALQQVQQSTVNNKVTTPLASSTTSTTSLLTNGAATGTMSSPFSLPNSNVMPTISDDDDTSRTSTNDAKCIANRTEIIIVNNVLNGGGSTNNSDGINSANVGGVRLLNRTGSSSTNNMEHISATENIATAAHRVAIKQTNSPVAKPRQNAPSRKLRKSQENIITNQVSTDQLLPDKHVIEISSPPTTLVTNNQENCNHHHHSNEMAASAFDTLSSISPSLIVKMPPQSKSPAVIAITLDAQPSNETNVAKQIDRNHLEITNFELENNRRNTMMADIVSMNNQKNYTNAAERLFTEIIIKSAVAGEQERNDTNYETKLEHCIQVRTPSPPGVNSSFGGGRMENVTAVDVEAQTDGNCVAAKVTPKKVSFHELLISELAAMHNNSRDSGGQLSVVVPSGVEHEPHLLPERKRIPSTGSTDSSPNGTRKARIRTADWVEVGDNGKEVLLSSCQISLEDSGLEDEERLDDVSSSGVGDSWDSVKDIEERYVEY